MTCGDKAGGTGSPAVPGITAQIRRYETDEVTFDGIFLSGDRLHIDNGQYRSGRETNFGNGITYLDPGEALQLNIVEVGGGPQGQDLDVAVFLSPAPPTAT